MAHIKSMDDLRKAESEDDSRDENDYYAGGKSGQIIRGPPDEDDEDEDKVSSLFDKARRSGAVQGTSSDLKQPSSSFRGQGRTVAGGPQAGAAPQAGGPQVHVITFYRNHVFTVDSGPPRRVDDPANFDFIASISKGECPKELEPSQPGTEISVNLVRKEEDFSEPGKSRHTVFQGTGQTLGGGSSSSAAAAAAAPASTSTEWAGVDESQPATSLQLRLADGSRMVARFNHGHRISDIRRFIRAARPKEDFSYALMSGVPPQPITGEDRTLAEAGLLNAVIIQRK